MFSSKSIYSHKLMMSPEDHIKDSVKFNYGGSNNDFDTDDEETTISP